MTALRATSKAAEAAALLKDLYEVGMELEDNRLKLPLDVLAADEAKTATFMEMMARAIDILDG